MTDMQVHSAAGLSLDDTIVTAEYTIGAISLLDHTGDTRLMWDSRNPDEVAEARAMFERLSSRGHLIYKAEGKDGRRGEQIREFDPTVERIIAMKAPVGG